MLFSFFFFLCAASLRKAKLAWEIQKKGMRRARKRVPFFVFFAVPFLVGQLFNRKPFLY